MTLLVALRTPWARRRHPVKYALTLPATARRDRRPPAVSAAQRFTAAVPPARPLPCSMSSWSNPRSPEYRQCDSPVRQHRRACTSSSRSAFRSRMRACAVPG
ncbi:hypothetical protein ACU4GD_27355 [Cupriavidus basilensis]